MPNGPLHHKDSSLDALGHEAIEGVRDVGDAFTAPEPPAWWWGSWVLWIGVIALLASFIVESIKQWGGLRDTRRWKKAKGRFAKIGLLAPLLFGIGGVLGATILLRAPAMYHEGSLMTDWLLAAALGAVSTIFSVPLWELGNFFFGLARFRSGQAVGLDTATIEKLSEEAASPHETEAITDDSDDKLLVDQTAFREALKDVVEEAMYEHESGKHTSPVIPIDESADALVDTEDRLPAVIDPEEG